jgi:zinc protease
MALPAWRTGGLLMRAIGPAAALMALAHAGCRAGGPDSACASPGAPSLTAGVTRTVLPNGLVVLTREMHEAPVVSAMIWYRVGSSDEGAGETGVSHFLEHMMFKGTDRYAKSEIDRITQQNGGRNNAFTSKDCTAYFFDFASDRWEVALEIEANRMRSCLLDPKEFQSEREVVVEEIQRALDTPWSRLEDEVETRLFPGHPYGHPVLGLREDLAALTRDRMAAYYRRFYTPDNAVLVLTGDFVTARALETVRARFGPIPRGPALASRPAAPAVPPADRTVGIDSPHNLDRLMIAYRAVPFRDEADAALDVASILLGDGKSSRLSRRLVEGDRLVSDVGCYADTRRAAGVFTVTAELLPGKPFDAVERAVGEELARMAAEPAGARELEKAKNIVAAQFVFSKETAHGAAIAIGQFEILGSFDYVDVYLEKVRRVTAADVQAVARRVFRDDGRVTGRSRAAKAPAGPEGETGEPGDAGRGAAWRTGTPSDGAFGPARRADALDALVAREIPGTAAGAADFKLPPARREVLPNGLTVLALRRPGTPSFAMRAHVDAGLLVEPEAKAGVARIVTEMLREGTAARTGAELAEAIAFVGGALESAPDGLVGRVLAKDADLLLELAADALRNPVFPAEAFARVREQTLSDIAGEDDQPAAVARKRLRERVYGAHPYHRPPLGYRKTVEALTRDDAVRHHAAFYRPGNTVVAVVGDEDPEAMAARVRRRFGDWPDAGPVTKPPLPPLARQTEPCRDEVPSPSAQAHLLVGHLGIRRNDPDYFPLLVADNVLGVGAGFTDRLSRRIRDELGLAYEVHGSITRSAAKEPGTFAVYVGTRHENRETALTEVRELVARFVREGPTEEEVSSAKAYLLGSYVFQYETAGALAEHLVSVERLGLGLDYLSRYPARVAAVTRDDAARAARAHLHPEALTIVVVGTPPSSGGK